LEILEGETDEGSHTAHGMAGPPTGPPPSPLELDAAKLDDLTAEEAASQGGGLWLRSLCLDTLEYRGRWSTRSTNILGQVWVGTLVDVVEFTESGIVMGIVLF
jgi:hypothetical protein